MKNKILVAFIFVFSVLGFTQQALAEACGGMSCTATCRYSCTGTSQSDTGCGDAEYARKLKACCDGAFASTPGINDVPCTATGPDV